MMNFPTPHDVFLFHEGNLFHSYRMLGSHLSEVDGIQGVTFGLWAPNAKGAAVVGDFNHWNGERHRMQKLNDGAIWVLFIPGLNEGTLYKFELISADGRRFLKADPYAFHSEIRPGTASIVRSLKRFSWTDDPWRDRQKTHSSYSQPMLIYEVHPGTWKRPEDEQSLSYRHMADDLVEYAVGMGYTHIEFLPLAEHPFDRSWGYQITGFYSITSRYGTPEDFMYLVNRCHESQIGVILDWVPAHFCKDDHGLRLFDGSPLYEHEDSKLAEKPLWGTLTFDYGKPEVQSFLISNALFWMDVYHIDGLRVDAVASMLQLNFDKPRHQWTTNALGGTDNLEAVSFLKKLNEAVFHQHPHALMMAEDSSDWPLVTYPTDTGGLGFNYKWNMGWMNDVLRYMEKEPADRKYHHHWITFSLWYAFSENYVLPLSHDEVVHGKKSLLNKMPGDYWQKFSNLRLLFGYFITHPGKKLLFMGGEWGQFDEWKDLDQLDWMLLDYEMHRKMHHYVRQLNHLYLRESSLWELDFKSSGFEWIDADNAKQSIISFIRKGSFEDDFMLIVCNFTPRTYHEYRVGVPSNGVYREVFNSDDPAFGGSGLLNPNGLEAKKVPWHKRNFSIQITVPPLGVVFFKPNE